MQTKNRLVDPTLLPGARQLPPQEPDYPRSQVTRDRGDQLHERLPGRMPKPSLSTEGEELLIGSDAWLRQRLEEGDGPWGGHRGEVAQGPVLWVNGTVAHRLHRAANSV